MYFDFGGVRRGWGTAPKIIDAVLGAASPGSLGGLVVGRRAVADRPYARLPDRGRPLDRFYTRVQSGQVEVGPRYSVNSEFERFPSYRDPGQDLDGVGQYLYPGRFSTPKLD